MTITSDAGIPGKNARIYIAGHAGMVGSAILRRLVAGGYSNLITRSREQLDLTDQRAVSDFFTQERPDYVFLAAAKVGGIQANNTYRAEFIYRNLMIAANVIHAAWQAGVTRLLFLGSSCIYPRDCPQPIKEEYLLSGPLEPTNEPYAIAKIAGLKLCESFNRQYGTRYVSLMPTNLYGPGDNYNLDDSHVVPALIRKAHQAKFNGDGQLVVWGSGKPLREFLYVDDLADACVAIMESSLTEGMLNVGSGVELSIRELAETVMSAVGYRGHLVFDHTKPDGTPRKLLDLGRIHALGWHARTSLRAGLIKAYQDFLQRESNRLADDPVGIPD